MAQVCVFDREMIASIPPPNMGNPDAEYSEQHQAMSVVLTLIAPVIGHAFEAINLAEETSPEQPQGFLGIDNNMSLDPARAIDPEGFIGDRPKAGASTAHEAGSKAHTQHRGASRSAREEQDYSL